MFCNRLTLENVLDKKYYNKRNKESQISIDVFTVTKFYLRYIFLCDKSFLNENLVTRKHCFQIHFGFHLLYCCSKTRKYVLIWSYWLHKSIYIFKKAESFTNAADNNKCAKILHGLSSCKMIIFQRVFRREISKIMRRVRN